MAAKLCEAPRLCFNAGPLPTLTTPQPITTDMEPNNVLQWKETAPGIWTPVPEGEPAVSKGPVRQITSLEANQPSPGTTRQASKRRIPPSLPTDARG